MTDTPAEVEAKFEIGDDDRQRLTTLDYIGAFTVISRQTLDQDDLYFDTVDERLAEAGATLRVRTNQRGAFMTFKGRRVVTDAVDEQHVATRPEDEIPLPDDYAARVSAVETLPLDTSLSPLRRALDLTRPTELRPTARLRNARTVIILEDGRGQQAELAIDDCVATRLSDGRVVEFREVELEAKSADRATLLAMASQLRTVAPSLRSSLKSKLERALR